MMLNSIEIFASLFECAITVFFLNKFISNKKIGLIPSLGLFFLLAADNVLLSQRFGYEIISVLIMIFLCSVYAYCFLSRNIIFNSVTILLNLLIIFVINLLLLSFISHISGSYIFELQNNQGILRFTVIFYSKFIYFLIAVFAIYMKEKSKIRISKTELAIVLLFSISSFIIYLGSFLISPEISPKYAMNFFVLLLGIIFVNIAIFPLLVHLSKENIKKAELMLIAQHIENQKNSVNIMEENYAEMRKLKHNIKTYVNNINLLISDGKIEKAAALGNSILSDKVLSDTDFDILNAVLNAKIKLAKSQNIDFSFLITDNISLLANTEINIVIMNLVDNAIEASKGVGGARVLLTIFKNKSYMNILVKNRIQTSVLSENPNLETTKKDSENHGFGIKSVKDIVNKFSGRVDFYEEDGYFCANVLVGSR